MMPKKKKKNKDTSKGECEGAEGGLVDLGLDDENEEKKLKQIVYEEEKCIKDFLETTNKQILEKECDALALSYLRSVNAFDQAKRDLAAIQVKRATKHQQKQERKSQIQYKDLKRQRNEVLARLVVISMYTGKHEQYFVDDPMGKQILNKRNMLKKSRKLIRLRRLLCMKRTRGMHKRKQKRKNKSKKGR